MRFATYNVHGWRGTDGRRSPARIGEVVASLNADVIALQEVDAPGEAEREGPLADLAADVGMSALAGPTIVGESRSYGNALLTRLPVRAVRRLDISVDGREPRGVLDARLDADGRPLRVVVTHFGLRPFERRRQVELLCELLDRDDREPVVVLGDFNEWWPRALTLLRLRERVGWSPAVRSWPSRVPLLALDRIWVRPEQALSRTWAVRNAVTRRASDHLPVCAEVDADALARASL